MTITPLNSLNLNNYIYCNPAKDSLLLHRKHLTTKTLSIITAVAVAAILATVLTLSFCGIVLTGYSSYLVAGLVLTTPFLAYGAGMLYKSSIAYEKHSKREKLVASHITNDTIKNFENEYKTKLTTTINLATLIGRFNYFVEKSNKLRAKEKELKKELPKSNQHRTIVCHTKWALKQKWLKNKLKAAVLLHIIKNPTYKQTKLSELGYFALKSYGLHQFDKNKNHPNDTLFLFNEEKKQPLNFSQVKNSSIVELHDKLFEV